MNISIWLRSIPYHHCCPLFGGHGWHNSQQVFPPNKVLNWNFHPMLSLLLIDKKILFTSGAKKYLHPGIWKDRWFLSMRLPGLNPGTFAQAKHPNTYWYKHTTSIFLSLLTAHPETTYSNSLFPIRWKIKNIGHPSIYSKKHWTNNTWPKTKTQLPMFSFLGDILVYLGVGNIFWRPPPP